MKNPKSLIFTIILVLANSVLAYGEEIQLTDYRYENMEYLFDGYTLAYDRSLDYDSKYDHATVSFSSRENNDIPKIDFQYEKNYVLKQDGSLFICDPDLYFKFSLLQTAYADYGSIGDIGSAYELDRFYPQGSDGNTYLLYHPALYSPKAIVPEYNSRVDFSYNFKQFEVGKTIITPCSKP